MDSINKAVPKLRNLFNNQVNLCLIALVVIFTMLLNVPVGAMLLFVTLYAHLYYRTKHTMVMREAFQNNHLHKQVLDLVADEDPAFNHGTNANSHIEPDQNKVEIARAVNDLPKNPELTKSVSKSVERAMKGPKKCDQANDLLTQTFDKNRNGFDVAGCRYDMKASPQNLTMNGPPVAQCGNYNKDKMNMIGTAFYPLNH